MKSVIAILLFLILIFDAPSVGSIYVTTAIRLSLFSLFLFLSISTIRSSITISILELCMLFLTISIFLCGFLFSNSPTQLLSLLVRVSTCFVLCNLAKDFSFFQKYLKVVKIFFFLLLFSLLLSSIALLFGAFSLPYLMPYGQDNGYPVAATLFGYFNRATVPFRPTAFLFEPIHLGFTFSLYLILFATGKCPVYKNKTFFVILSFIGAFLSLSASTWIFLGYIICWVLSNYFLSNAFNKRIPSYLLPLVVFLFVPFSSVIIGLNSGQLRIDNLFSTVKYIYNISLFDLFHPVSAVNVSISPDVLTSLLTSTGILFTSLIIYIASKRSINSKNYLNSLIYIFPFFVVLNPLQISFFLYFYIPLMLVDHTSLPHKIDTHTNISI